ncbi:MAG: tetratricopeptide repeat protein, partial [Betaproteobacteria bacterium]|nr:tetratricopeptide repeat protein [Betaproteobacteria bacterium]
MSTSTPPNVAAAEAWFQTGLNAHQHGDFPNAEQAYRQALALLPGHVGALHLLGVLAAQAGHLEPAITLMTRASAIDPSDFSILNNLGNTLVRAQKFEDALKCLDAALRLRPEAAQLHINRGNALSGLQRYVVALAAYDEALAVEPEHAEAWANKTTTLVQLQRYEEALACGERAAQLAPASALAHNAKGMAHYGLRQWPEAGACFVEALKLRPDYADAQYNYGLIHHYQRRWADARPWLEAAARQEPHNADYQMALADNYYGAGDRAGALATMDRAESRGVRMQGHAFIRSMLTASVCDWQRRSEEIKTLRTTATKIPTPPFAVLGMVDDPVFQKEAAHCWVTQKYFVPQGAPRFQRVQRNRERNIRVGYFSADFRDHATMHLMAEFLELHDAQQFEIIAYSFRPPSGDAMEARVRAAFSQWHEVDQWTDRAIVDHARSLDLDIAVDLKGYTSEARPAIFLERVAPVQVAYLGYPGSFGVSAMDYLLADRQLVSADEHEAYAEKIVRLPHTYQVNDRQRFRNIRDDLDRADCGLPADGFVYCCFNNNYKIGPDMFDVWMRLLQKTPGSVLWLLEDSAEAADNLRREAQLRGVDPARLIFAPRVETQRHLERLVLADLFLDTFPYNAHTTASEALWMGLPLLTLRGRSFASRVASSLLHAVELPQLVTTTLEDYEALAW